MSTHRHFRRVKIDVVNSAAGKVSPAGRQPPFDGLERNIEVNDRVHAVGVLQSFCLRYRPRETWRTNVGATQRNVLKPVMEVQCQDKWQQVIIKHKLFQIHWTCATVIASFQHSLILLPQSSACTPRSCLACSPLCVLQWKTDSLFTFLSPVRAPTFLSDVTQPSPTVYSIQLYLYSDCYNRMICRRINLHNLSQWLDYAEYTVVNPITTIMKCYSLNTNILDVPSSSQLLSSRALRSFRMRRDMTSSGTNWPWSIQDFINRPSSFKNREELC